MIPFSKRSSVCLPMRHLVHVLAVLSGLLVLASTAGCGGDEENGNKTRVVVSLYPLAWAAERVGGDAVEVVNLTPPGAEPHDVELSAGDVEAVRDADLVVYGSYPGSSRGRRRRGSAQRDVRRCPRPGQRSTRVARSAPLRLAGRGDRGRARPAGAAQAPVAELRRLDRQYRNGLADCKRRTVVTTHSAFKLLAKRYRLEELSLAGRSPESEPGARELERLVGLVRESGATAVFAEPLVSDRAGECLATRSETSGSAKTASGAPRLANQTRRAPGAPAPRARTSGGPVRAKAPSNR